MIVKDFRKCVSIIDSCCTESQLASCINLVSNFNVKHKLAKTAFARYKELYRYVNKRLRELEKDSFSLITS